MIKYFIFLCCLSLPACASSPLTLSGKLAQGNLILGKTQPKAKIFLDGVPVMVGNKGTFIFGFSRDSKLHASIKVITPDDKTYIQDLAIEKRDWDIQRIDGLKEKFVTPSSEIQKRINTENTLIIKARRIKTKKNLFGSGFIKPAKGPITGVFGSQRILNGTAKSPHAGTDIGAPEGTTVWAIADGTITLAHPGMFYTGKTIMIDHGFGLSSIYAHLSHIDVKKGQAVKKGDVIGKVGKTGRATGAHLHWGLSWFDTKLDPESISEIKEMQ